MRLTERVSKCDKTLNNPFQSSALQGLFKSFYFLKMERNSGKKFRSVRRKKRRGFFGKRPQEMTDDLSNVATRDSDNHDRLAVVGDDSLAHSAQKCESITSKKLLNTSFEKLEGTERILTRQKAKEVGIQPAADVEIACGFKMQDAVLLSNCISKAAICSSCRHSKSRLELYQENTRRDGLSEHLFLKCSHCNAQTPLATSNRLGGKGGGAYEVNRRSVLSSHHTTGEDLVKPIIFRCRLIMQVYYAIAQSAKMLDFSSLNFNVVVATSGKTHKNLLKRCLVVLFI